MLIKAGATEWRLYGPCGINIRAVTSTDPWDNPEEARTRLMAQEEQEFDSTAAAAIKAICRAARERFRFQDRENNLSKNPPRRGGTGNKQESKKKEQERIKRARREKLSPGAKRVPTKMNQIPPPI